MLRQVSQAAMILYRNPKSNDSIGNKNLSNRNDMVTIEGEVSVEQVNVEMPLIHENKFLFRMRPGSKILSRFDISS